MELLFIVYSILKQCWSVGYVSLLTLSFIIIKNFSSWKLCDRIHSLTEKVKVVLNDHKTDRNLTLKHKITDRYIMNVRDEDRQRDYCYASIMYYISLLYHVKFHMPEFFTILNFIIIFIIIIYIIKFIDQSKQLFMSLHYDNKS